MKTELTRVEAAHYIHTQLHPTVSWHDTELDWQDRCWRLADSLREVEIIGGKSSSSPEFSCDSPLEYKTYNPDSIFDDVFAIRKDRHDTYNKGDNSKRVKGLRQFGLMVCNLIDAVGGLEEARATPGIFGSAILAGLKNLRSLWARGHKDSYIDLINYGAIGAECAAAEVEDFK